MGAELSCARNRRAAFDCEPTTLNPDLEDAYHVFFINGCVDVFLTAPLVDHPPTTLRVVSSGGLIDDDTVTHVLAAPSCLGNKVPLSAKLE